MMHLGLIGYPLEHSISPLLHEAALHAAGLRGEYRLYSVHPDDHTALGALVDRVRGGELDGLNVTVPHKQAVMPFLDEVTPAARAIGAVNCLCIKAGKVLGDNTDAPGFLADLRGFGIAPRSAMVLGAGGAARAVVYALWTTGCQVSVATRRIEQARELSGRFAGVRAIELGAQALEAAKADLVINATPLGMFPSVDESPWPTGAPFPESATVYDLVYNPRETVLIRQAHKAGLRAVNGLGMLIEQAMLAFELWTGFKMPREALSDAIGQAAL